MDMYEIKWIGDGELTSVGMRIQYLIGVHIRNKYSNLYIKILLQRKYWFSLLI